MATGRKKSKKRKQQDTVRFGIVILIALIILLIIFIISKLSKKEGGEVTPAPSPTTIALTTETPTPKPEATEAPAATKKPVDNPTEAPVPTAEPVEPTKEPEATSAPTSTPAPTKKPENKVTEKKDAEALLFKKIDKNAYTVTMYEDRFKDTDGNEFFAFIVSDKENKSMVLHVVVSKETGKIYYNDDGLLSEMTKFPPDNVVTKDPSEVIGKGITADQAYKLLCTLDKDVLGLLKKPSEYTAEYDKEAYTPVMGKNCYDIELLETSNGKKILRGRYFISEDGLDCYYVDPDTETFVPIPIG